MIVKDVVDISHVELEFSVLFGDMKVRLVYRGLPLPFGVPQDYHIVQEGWPKKKLYLMIGGVLGTLEPHPNTKTIQGIILNNQRQVIDKLKEVMVRTFGGTLVLVRGSYVEAYKYGNLEDLWGDGSLMIFDAVYNVMLKEMRKDLIVGRVDWDLIILDDGQVFRRPSVEEEEENEEKEDSSNVDD